MVVSCSDATAIGRMFVRLIMPRKRDKELPTEPDMNLFPAFYIIAYDLHEPGKNYQTVKTQIESLPDPFRIFESTWLVKTKLNSTEILKHLSTALDSNDHVLITKIDLASCDGWLPLNARVWLEQKTAGF